MLSQQFVVLVMQIKVKGHHRNQGLRALEVLLKRFAVDGEMAEIASSNVRGKKKKKGRAAKKAEKKAAKEALKKQMSDDGKPAVWQSPNTVGELDSLRKQSAPPDGEQVRCVWAMSFSNKVVSDVVGDEETGPHILLVVTNGSE